MFSAGTAVSILKASTNISLNNVDVKHAGKNAIVAEGGENISIENCVIDDAVNNGIVFKGSAENKLRNSVIRGCTVSRVHSNDCITLHKNSDLDDIGSGHLLENNVASQCGEQGIDVTSGSDITLLGNTTYGNGDSGIVLGHGVTNIVVENHLSVDDGRYAGILVNDAQDVSIANSCILDSIKHQVVFRDAQDVNFEGNIVYQGQDRHGSLIDIALIRHRSILQTTTFCLNLSMTRFYSDTCKTAILLPVMCTFILTHGVRLFRTPDQLLPLNEDGIRSKNTTNTMDATRATIPVLTAYLRA